MDHSTKRKKRRKRKAKRDDESTRNADAGERKDEHTEDESRKYDIQLWTDMKWRRSAGRSLADINNRRRREAAPLAVLLIQSYNTLESGMLCRFISKFVVSGESPPARLSVA